LSDNDNFSTYIGTVDRISYRNEENEYCIADFQIHKSREIITIAGILPAVNCGENLKVLGEWTTHPVYGKQLQVKKFQSRLPSSVHGIRKYLGSGLIPGIGKVYADKIVDYFAEKTFEVISHESGRLKEVPGIGAKRAKQIKAAWDQQQAVREVMLFLKTYGIGNSQCLKLVKNYGSEAKAVILDNPYKLADEIAGIGFLTADKIALNLGLPSNSEKRINAGLLYTMSSLEEDGHTIFEDEIVLNKTAELLQVDSTIITPRIQDLIATRRLVIPSPGRLQLKGTELKENDIAKAIHFICKAPSNLPSIHVEKAVEWAQKQAGFAFASQQSQAIRNALENKFSILTGGPGTGKTTILASLVKILKAKKVRILLASPTGRAAQRLAESTRSYAQTIHRLLKFDPAQKKFSASKEHPLKCDFIIIDESSMLDTRLAASLFQALPASTHLLLVGDVDQLPSVGNGNVLRDLIHSGFAKVTELNMVFRQKEDSSIVSVAHAILEGRVAIPPSVKIVTELNKRSDMHFISAPSPEETLIALKNLFDHRIPQSFGLHPIRQTQLIVPMHKGIAGIENINIEAQKILNPSPIQMQVGKYTYRKGDKVIQMKNDYDKNIFNGDVGYITKLNLEDKTALVLFDNQEVEFEKSDFLDLQLAYAISVHKSQGSEYPLVIIPILKQHFMLLQKNLIYTAITRGKQKVIIIGDSSAYAMAVKNSTSTERKTHLVEKLHSQLPDFELS
jgi:exodeoxyribonuclease V alpha subunit